MTSGVDLLRAARGMSAADVARVFGTETGSESDRAALIAALLSTFTAADAPLIRELTQLEIDAVRDADDGCGDVLLACCWLLFMIGEVGDAALIWNAKNVNFDTHSYIDSIFLIPSGAAATAAFARSTGLSDLAKWVEEPWLGDTDLAAREWRTGSFFARAPSADAPAAELAAWLQE